MLSLPELTFFRALLQTRIAHARRSEAGASAVEWVIITAVLVAIVGTVAAIITERITSKAESINP